MTEQKKNLVTETSLAYGLSAVAALLSFLIGWLICAAAGLCRT